MEGIVETQADLAVQLLRETSLVDPSVSVIISPISIAIALSMVFVGAKRETKRELRTLLAGDLSDAHLLNYFNRAVHYLGAHHNNYSLESANTVYVDKSIRVFNAYHNAIYRHFRGGFERIDVKDTFGTAKKINDFVDEATSHKIRNVIRAQDIKATSRLFLVNALHFKGEWTQKFYREMSFNSSFYSSEGQRKQVTMMQQKSFFIYFEDDQAQVLGLPYEGNEVYMFVILPKERFRLEQLLRNLNGKKLAQYITKRATKEVEVFLPRFEVQSSFELSRALKKLGLTNVFGGQADFSGITDSEALRVGQVIHKAVIEVNEEGSEAAAATVVEMMAGSSGQLPPKPTQFKADHPFAYAIVDSHAKVLFFGKIFADMRFAITSPAYLIPPESCCTQAVLFRNAAVPAIVAELSQELAHIGHAKDHILDESRFYGRATEMNAVAHIGLFSVLHQQISKPQEDWRTGLRNFIMSL